MSWSSRCLSSKSLSQQLHHRALAGNLNSFSGCFHCKPASVDGNHTIAKAILADPGGCCQGGHGGSKRRRSVAWWRCKGGERALQLSCVREWLCLELLQH
ncbi:hypothetical protein BHM03_00001659 [Ensete ventricosum]|nr:hypothetical protein BHM03_00001659 [Ensete ventricosum]